MQNINIVFEHLNEDKTDLVWPNGIEKNDQEKYNLCYFQLGPGGYNLHIIFRNGTKSDNVKLFHYKELESGVLPKDEKYLYFLDISKPWNYPQMFKYDNFFTIPKLILNDVKNNKARIVIFIGYEGTGFAPIQFDPVITYIQNMIKNNGLPQHGIVYADGNVLCEAHLKQFNIKGYYYNVFQSAKYYNIDYVTPEKYNEIKNNIINKVSRPKKYLCFNRAPREHRGYLVERMLKNNLVEDAIVTHCGVDYIDNVAGLKSNPFPYHLNIDVEYLKKHVPLVYDVKDIKKENPNYLNVEAQTKCYFNVVTETWFDHDPTRMYYSEKIFKPITCLQPFILVGQPFSLRLLRDMGFKTFGNFIDESYDETINKIERLDKIMEVVKKIYSMSQAELNDMLYNMLPVLEWNYNNNVFVSHLQDGNHFLERIINDWD